VSAFKLSDPTLCVECRSHLQHTTDLRQWRRKFVT